MSENRKYCSYIKEKVHLSTFNKYGACECLKCKEPKCKGSICDVARLRKTNAGIFNLVPCHYCSR